MQDVLDRRDDSLLKAASGLAGGIGQMRDVCGSLLGASLMLGTQFGRGREELGSEEKLRSSYVPVGKLYKWFEKEFGSVKCREVKTRFAGGVYYETQIPWQKELADEAGVSNKCRELVGKTAARAAEMVWDALAAETDKPLPKSAGKLAHSQPMAMDAEAPESRQERREKKLRKKRERMPQHGKSLAKVYTAAVKKRAKK